MKMHSAKQILWGYFVEIAAAVLTLIALSYFFSLAAIVAFLRSAAIDVATLFCGIVFAAALGFLWTCYSKIDTPFYLWLDKQGALAVYLSATGYVIGVSAAATLALIGMKNSSSDTIAIFAIFLLLLDIINLYTLVQNVLWLIRMNTRFCHIQQQIMATHQEQ